MRATGSKIRAKNKTMRGGGGWKGSFEFCSREEKLYIFYAPKIWQCF